MADQKMRTFLFTVPPFIGKEVMACAVCQNKTFVVALPHTDDLSQLNLECACCGKLTAIARCVEVKHQPNRAAEHDD